MILASIQETLNKIESNLAVLAPHRKSVLYRDFLVQGYTAVTLSSVPADQFSALLRAKLCMGTLITLYDDLADRPSQLNPELLADLYQFSFGRRPGLKNLNPRYQHIFHFVEVLFETMENVLGSLPRFKELIEFLNFDLAQFYNANQFSSLITANGNFGNQLENRLYAHHNMGMMIIFMMDLMALPQMRIAELGVMREVFLIGQRIGRICNVLTTTGRELLDDDITGELATLGKEEDILAGSRKLRKEIALLRRKISSYESKITTFSVVQFLHGLAQLQLLHEGMEGLI